MWKSFEILKYKKGVGFLFVCLFSFGVWRDSALLCCVLPLKGT